MIERSVSWFYTEWVDADGVVRFTHDAVRRIYTDTETVYSGYDLMDARVEVDRYEGRTNGSGYNRGRSEDISN